MQKRIDNLILVADVQGQVVGVYHSIYLDFLFLLNLVERPQEKELIDALLDVSILGLKWSVACDAGLDLSGESSTVVEIKVWVECHCFFDCFAVLGVVSWDECAISQRFFVDFIFNLRNFVVKILQDLTKSDFFQFFLGNFATFLLQCALGIVEEGLNLREGEVVVTLTCAFPLFDESYECIVDEQSP